MGLGKGATEGLPIETDAALFYVWRGLVYWEKTLPGGLDLNGDGVEDHVFIGRAWSAKPAVMFFDGAKYDALAEYEIPNGRTLGLEIVRRDGKKTAILAVTEFHLGLYSTEGAQELWRVRFDTPAAGYTMVSTDAEPLICVA